jgi:di/tricarboxylate transporter
MEVELWKQILTCAVLVLVFLAFVKEWASPDLVAMSGFLVLVLAGVVEVGPALKIFGSSAPVTVAAMFIVSAALERTGLIEALGAKFESVAGGGSETKVLLILLLLVAVLSAFVNNTPVVVVFLPIVLRHCRKFDLKASRFLIPLSYAAIVGGTCTIIGTSTNLIASGTAVDFAAKSGTEFEPFGMFEVAKLGLVFVAITLLYLLCGGRKLIPDRVTLSTLFESSEGREFLTQAYINEGSPLVGAAFTQSPLAKMNELRVIEVVRDGATVRTPLNEMVFEVGDQLTFKTRAGGVMEINATHGLDLMPEAKGDLGLANVKTESAVLMEGILGRESRLVGKSLKELNFRQRFGVLIIAVHRRGRNLRNRFEDVKLEFGDTLLVEGPVERMNALFSEKDFVNLSKPKERPLRRRKAPIVIGALLLFMIGGVVRPDLIPVLAMTAVLIVLLSNCIEGSEAYEAVEWRVIFMIFGMLGIGLAMQESKIAEIVAESAVATFGRYGPQVVLMVIYLLAAVLTELISNNAVAALLTPIALGLGISLDVDPRPFVVAVMFASSASFVTPIGYQTNTYVYGAGGYKFTDFTRAGLPLALVLWLVASFLIPLLWSFDPK